MKRNAKLLLALTATLSTVSYAQKRPNIILFMVDDMGWQDTSLPFWRDTTIFNRIYHTPAMERLATTGTKFTQAYASSVSSPSRTTLMTGLDPARHRVTNWTLEQNKSTDDEGYNGLKLPDWNVNGLQPRAGIDHSIVATPFPQILRQNGYTTIHCGKAHWGAIGTPGENPLNLGFDVNIAGHAAGGLASYLGEQNFGNKTDGTPQSLFAVPGLEKYWGQNIFVTEALTLEAIEAIEQATAKDQPFYLYMSHYAIHIPLNKDERYYQKYRDAGLEDMQARYASLIEGMDKSLGDIMDYLKRKGIADNTIIIFMSDNGGLSLSSGREGRENSHNYPLNAGKGSVYEGGIRVPMIVNIPGRRKVSQCDTPVSMADFMPTILDMAQIKNYRTIQKLDGVSLMPMLMADANKDKSMNRSLYWHFPNKWGGAKTDRPTLGYGATSAIRSGNWKLIYYYQTGMTEFFNLSEDIFEIVDQSKNRNVSHLMKQMADDLTKYLRRTKAQIPSHPNGRKCTYPNGDKVR